jgi:hypothetical protein
VLHISDVTQAEKDARYLWCGRSVNVYNEKGDRKKNNSVDSSEDDTERKTVSHRE